MHFLLSYPSLLVITFFIVLGFVRGLLLLPINFFFADDTIIFGQANPEEASHIFQVTFAYEQTSRQQMNPSKIEISSSQNVSTLFSNELEVLYNLKVVWDHRKYLGLLTLIGRSKVEAFAFLKGKVSKKIERVEGNDSFKSSKGNYDKNNHPWHFLVRYKLFQAPYFPLSSYWKHVPTLY